MDAIVAVYDDWGIGRDGTQPIAVSADRKFFREMTRGAMVIVGSRTVEDFPGQKPLPGRRNIVLSRKAPELPGFCLCKSPEEAVELTNKHLPTFKHIQFTELRDTEFEKTTTRKIKRFLVK